MRLLIQPGEGAAPIVKALEGAKESIDILIFRFDRRDVERALLDAVGRGVRVRALIASTNKGGEKTLRELESRLLAAGITVARTADDLQRYHGKMMVIDSSELYLLAFNFTYIDMDRSRTFGLVIEHPKLVADALKLFEADMLRQPYCPGEGSLVVSPLNARDELSAFIKAAKETLLIYDPEVSDAAMVRLLNERIKAGVAVRIIGRAKLPARKLAKLRLHTRTLVRDGEHVFVGSQSLRRAELDKRREVGVIFRDPKIAAQITKVFDEDWGATEASSENAADTLPLGKIAKRVAKVVTKGLPPVAPVIQAAMKEVAGNGVTVRLKPEELEEVVEDAVKHAVKEAVRDVVEEAVPPLKER